VTLQNAQRNQAALFQSGGFLSRPGKQIIVTATHVQLHFIVTARNGDTTMNYPHVLTVEEASQRPTKFGAPPIAVSTLNKWRVVGGGPPFMRFGRRVVYPLQPFDEFMLNRLTPQVLSTSEL
jgi:hypothetical protein